MMKWWIFALFLVPIFMSGCSMLPGTNIYGNGVGGSSGAIPCPDGAYCEYPAYTNGVAVLYLPDVNNTAVVNYYN